MISAAALLVAAALAAGDEPSPPAGSAGATVKDSSIVVTVPEKVPLQKGGGDSGKTKGCKWKTVPWHGTVRIPASASLAYLDKAGFQAGTAGLTKSEITAVMRKRTHEKAQVLSDLTDETAREAGRLSSLPGPESARLYAIFLEGYGIGRSFGAKLEDVIQVLAGRVDLDALETEYAALPGSPKAGATDTALSARTREACAHAAAALGEPAFLKLAYVSRSQRVIFVGKPSIFQGEIDRNEIPSEPWDKGPLLTVYPSQLQKISKSGKPVTVFLSSAEYSRVQNMETGPQRKIHIDAILKQGGPGPGEYRAEIDRSRLDLLAVLSGFLAGDKTLPKAERDALESARAGESTRLVGSDSIPADKRMTMLRMHLEILSVFAAKAEEKALADWATHSLAALDAKP